MDSNIICPVYYLTITPYTYECFHYGLFISGTEPNYYTNKFTNPKFIEVVGSIDLDRIRNKPCFLYIANIDYIQNTWNSNRPDVITHCIGGLINSYVEALWFIKDNSCYCPFTYATYNDFDQTSVNYRNIFFTNSRGEYQNIEFTYEEMVQAVEIKDKMNETFSKINDYTDASNSEKFNLSTPDEGIDNLIAILHLEDYNFPRLKIAYFMLLNARSNGHIPTKITFYMSVLEALFTTGHKQITNTLIIRTCKFLDLDDCDKKAYKKILKVAYNVRSKLSHGQIIDEKLKGRSALQELSYNLDNIIRKVLVKAIKEFSEIFDSHYSVDSYFESLGLFHLVSKLTIGIKVRLSGKATEMTIVGLPTNIGNEYCCSWISENNKSVFGSFPGDELELIV